MGNGTSRVPFGREDREKLEQALNQAGYSMVAVTIRLAWQLGLQRREIHQLTWEQIDFAASVVRLPDREVPLTPEMQVYLQGVQASQRSAAGPVARSDRTGKRPVEQNLSHVTRQLLDGIGLEQARLLDLRYDYLEQLLRQHSLEYVSFVGGMDPRSLRMHFPGLCVPQSEPEETFAVVDAQRIRRILESEGDTAGGVALRLIWLLGLSPTVIRELRWDAVDWERRTLTADGETHTLPEELLGFLQELEQKNRRWSEYLLISDRAHGTVDRAHLSRMVRAALIRGGCPQVTVRDLRRDWEIRTRWAAPVQTYLERHKHMTRGEAASLLAVPQEQAARVLGWMLKRGMIVRAGHSYYLPGTVVPPEQQEAVVLAYLANHSGCRCGELGALLGLERKHCLTVLEKFQKRGLIRRKGNLYYRIGEEFAP